MRNGASGLARRLRRLVRGAEDDPRWARPALLVVIGATVAAYTWALNASGYGNEYYAAAAYSGSQSWSAWLFGSFDSASFISVDKPPLSLWLSGLSVRVFGLSSWSVLLPHALAGVATVVIVHHTVRRRHGHGAALLAGSAMAFTPVAVVMFRYNNPDALLTLLMVAAVAVTLSAVERGSAWRLAAAGGLVGLAFLTKTNQALLVVPGIAVTYLAFAPVSWARRILHGAGAALSAVIAAGWWIVLAETSAAAPYYGQTTTGSFIDYVLGVNGLDRVSGGGIGGGPDPFGGTGGWGRLFNFEVGDQVSWLIPIAMCGAAAALWGWRASGHRQRASWVMWITVFVTHLMVFSLVSGVFHPYYSLTMVPAIAALGGAGSVEGWRAFRAREASGWLLPVGIVGTGLWSWALLARESGFASGLGPAIGWGAVGAGALLVVFRAGVSGAGRLALAVAIAVAVAGPAAYAFASIGADYSGGDPKAGPGETGIPAARGDGHPTAAGGVSDAPVPVGYPDDRPPQRVPGGDAPGPDEIGSRTPQGPPPGAARGTVDDVLIEYLEAQYGEETWLTATVGSQTAAAIILSTGEAVMAMGGFSGGDPTPGSEELAGYVTSGELRFVLLPAGGRVDRWIGVAEAMCAPVDPDLYGNPAGLVLYDCATAAGASI